MKILIYGSSYPYALETFYKQHLEEQNNHVQIFAGANIFQTYYQTSVLNKLLFRLGISKIQRAINNKLLKETTDYMPDVLLVFKGMELFPETIEKIRHEGIYTVNYNPDHPFIFHGKGSGNKNVTNSIPYYDLHLSYSLKIKEELTKKFNVKCEWLPFGYEPVKIDLPTEKEEIRRVCFIGFADKQRADIIKQLVLAKVPVDVYGDNWQIFFELSEYLNIFPAVYNDSFNKTAIKYRVQLNLFRPHNMDSHNMRTFEMAGIGCIMLSPESKEHRIFFENEKEIFLFDSIENMMRSAKNILNMPYNDCLEIRQNVISRSLKSGYDYASRTKQLTGILKTLR